MVDTSFVGVCKLYWDKQSSRRSVWIGPVWPQWNVFKPDISPCSKHSTNMQRNVKAQSDITNTDSNYHNPDGSFKRAPSSFRDFIQSGGKFHPEKGAFTSLPLSFIIANTLATRSLPSLRLVCLPWVVSRVQHFIDNDLKYYRLSMGYQGTHYEEAKKSGGYYPWVYR